MPLYLSMSDVKIQQLEKASRDCRAMLRDNPRDAHCLYVLSLIEAQLGRSGCAPQYTRRALQLCHYANGPETLL